VTGEPCGDALRRRRVVLCADDFAQTQGTVDGIVSLLDAGRLSAVSCLVESSLWKDAASRLRGLPAKFDAGLHFNLTHDFAGDGHRPGALPLLLLATGLHMISHSGIEFRLHRQLDLFEREIGRPPDFIDGHQHVHQLPVVRDTLVSVLRSRYPSSGTAVRVTVPSEARGLKGSLVAGLGGRALLKAVRRARIPHNADFAGIYDFSSSSGFAERMSQWIADVSDGGLIVCHPAQAAPLNGDPIAAAREWEFSHLGSDAFPSLLRRWNVQLVRFRNLPAAQEGA